MHEESGSSKAIMAAFAANVGIAVSKLVGFLITGSAGLLAEAVHSFADTGNQGLLMLGGRRSKRAPSDTHPFGYGRERYFWAFVVAVVLFTLGGAFAVFEGIDKLRSPHELDSPVVAIVLLAVAVGLEGFSLKTAIGEASSQRGSARWSTFVRHAKAPELPVVLLEDVGALIGLVLALTGIVLAETTGNPRFDAIGSLAIGTLLIVIALFLATEMKSLLIGESATPEVVETIATQMRGAPSVRRLIHLRTQHLGPEELLVGAKLEFDDTLSFAELAAAIDEVEARVRAAVPAARVMYLEPDVHRP